MTWRDAIPAVTGVVIFLVIFAIVDWQTSRRR